MRSIYFSAALVCLSMNSFAQLSGNSNYLQPTIAPSQDIHIIQQTNQMSITVSGINNVKPDAFVAIFNLKQGGDSLEEVDRLMNNRLKEVTTAIEAIPGVAETYVDMISFTPLYEIEIAKKLFSKDSYNEIPAGFEVKKNLHIKFTDPKALDQIISKCAASEVYDLVRVDYYIEDMEGAKRALLDKAKEVYAKRLADYEQVAGASVKEAQKKVFDGFKVYYPIDRYKSYNAQQGTKMFYQTSNFKRSGEAPSTLYYEPIMNKVFDYTINPVVFQPVVQVVYQMTVVFTNEQRPEKEFFWLTPEGQKVILQP